jgi:hypothetical protein
MTSTLTGAGITALMEATLTASTAPAPSRATFPGMPVSIPAARQFVRDALADCPRAADLAQAVTELAANAVRWSAAAEGGTFNGWGLGIVRAITDRAGTTADPGPARTSWAEATCQQGMPWGGGGAHDGSAGRPRPGRPATWKH